MCRDARRAVAEDADEFHRKQIHGELYEKHNEDKLSYLGAAYLKAFLKNEVKQRGEVYNDRLCYIPDIARFAGT